MFKWSFFKRFIFLPLYLLMMSIIIITRRDKIADNSDSTLLEKHIRSCWSVITNYSGCVHRCWLLFLWYILIIIWFFFRFMFSRVFVLHRHTFWQFLLFKMHSIKHKYNSIALFSFLLILYESLVQALFDFEHEIKKEKKDDVPFPHQSIAIDRSMHKNKNNIHILIWE